MSYLLSMTGRLSLSSSYGRSATWGIGKGTAPEGWAPLPGMITGDYEWCSLKVSDLGPTVPF